MNKNETIKDIQNIINANCWTISEQFAKNVATVLYNAGYRKVPDGAVILTPEERDEELKACNEKQAEFEAQMAIEKANYYNKGVIDGRENFEYLNQRNKELYEEIKRLKADNEALKMWNDAYTKENEKLKAENHKLENDLVDFDEFARGISKTRIEITGEAIPTCKTLLEYIEKEKRNAVKEFAEKLKEKFDDYGATSYNGYEEEFHDLQEEIDEILKEYENE